MTRFPIRSENPNGWQMQRFADMRMATTTLLAMATTTLLADMQTLVLPDILEDLCSPANLRYQARSLLAQFGQKRDRHPLFCPRE